MGSAIDMSVHSTILKHLFMLVCFSTIMGIAHGSGKSGQPTSTESKTDDKDANWFTKQWNRAKNYWEGLSNKKKWIFGSIAVGILILLITGCILCCCCCCCGDDDEMMYPTPMYGPPPMFGPPMGPPPPMFHDIERPMPRRRSRSRSRGSGLGFVVIGGR